MSFSEAIEETGDQARTLLLGNGFSIDWCWSKFSYDSLYDKAELEGLSVGKGPLFSAMETKDFERAMAYLDLAFAIAGVYEEYGLQSNLHFDSELIRNGLTEVLTSTHPVSQNDIRSDEYKHARVFLSNFSHVFTLSYDLLLYWTFMISGLDELKPPCRDGFVGGDGQWVEWARNPQVFYLHGAFHLYTGEDGETHKLTYAWPNRIIDQLVASLQEKKYPLVVTEGTSKKKNARIQANPYLRFCLRKLGYPSQNLFIHGVALSENDDHIFARLADNPNSPLKRIYVSLYGPPDTKENQDIQLKARGIATGRKAKGGDEVEVKFYDSSTANVWRQNSTA